MNGNGHDFDAIVNHMPRVFIREEDPVIPPGPEDQAAFNLQTWASMPEVADVFLPWLEARIEALDDEEAANVRDHPGLLVAKGRRLEAKWMREQFHLWRGQPRKRPDAKE